MGTEYKGSLACGAGATQETGGASSFIPGFVDSALVPQIKEGWGWVKWDSESWNECSIHDHKEFVQERLVYDLLWKFAL